MTDVLGHGGIDATGERVARAVEEAFAGVPVASWGLTDDGERRLEQVLAGFNPEERAALLVTAYRQMPEMRAVGDGPRGALMYSVAGQLLRSRLPLREEQLCEMLWTSSHVCGHGVDTRGPFDLAHRFQQRNGYSPALGAAIRDYASRLPRPGGASVQALRRSAELLGVLDTGLGAVTKAESRWWINQVRASLADVTGSERTAWERLVVAMSVSEHMVCPRRWATVAQAHIDELGEDLVLSRLATWWPEPPVVSLQGSGAQLLKHFIWMLAWLPRAAGSGGLAETQRLVCSLAAVEWKPRPRPMAVLKPAAAHLAGGTSPQAVAARRHFQDLIAQG